MKIDKENDPEAGVEGQKGQDKKKREDKRARSPKKHNNGPVENKGPFSKYTNYNPLTTLRDQVYVVTNINLYKPPEPMKGDRVYKDIKRNYAFHKDIETKQEAFS